MATQGGRPPRRSRITINDVAEATGVSRATVSLVLQDSNRVSVATKERLRAAMVELGYVYDRRAANLRSQRAMTMGMIATDVRNPYFAEVTMGIEEEVSQAGYTLVLGYTRDILARQERVLRSMAEQRVDGIFLLPATGTTAKGLRQTLGGSQIPHVLFARRVRGHDSDYVGADNVKGGGLIAEHLHDIGIGSAAFLGGPEGSSARKERVGGLQRGLDRHGITIDPDQVIASSATAEGGAEAVEKLLVSAPLPDALVAYNDVVAFGVLRALRQNGIEPGRDVAVIGFDDVPAAAVEHPSLTTVATFPERIAVEAARLLIRRTEGADDGARQVLLEPELRVRDSTTAWTARKRRRNAAR